MNKQNDALMLLAYATLKHRAKTTKPLDITLEVCRLKRIIADKFAKSRLDQDYNDYITEFIKVYGSDVVYTNKFDDDIIIPDDYHDLDVNVMIDKYNRKKRGSKY